MGGYSEHRRAAILAAVIVTAATGYGLHSTGYTLQTVALGSSLMFGLTVVAGLAPDVDVSSSIPRRYLGKVVLGVTVGGVAYTVITTPGVAVTIGDALLGIVGLSGIPPIVAGGITLGVGSLVGAKSAGYGLDEVTTHRGWLHTVWFWAFLGLIAAGGLSLQFDLPPEIPAIVFLAPAIGATVHIKIVDRA